VISSASNVKNFGNEKCVKKESEMRGNETMSGDGEKMKNEDSTR